MAGFLSIFSLVAAAILLAAVAAVDNAEVAPEIYWKSVLPNTPIPNSIRQRLSPDFNDEKRGTVVNVGKGGVHVETGKGKPKGGTNVNVGKGGVHVNAGKGNPKGDTTVGVGPKGVGVQTGHGKTNVHVGKGGVNVHTGHKGKPVVVRVAPGKSPFNYVYAASVDQLHDDPSVALFFLEKDLHSGAKFDLFFPKATSSPSFLPRKVVDHIPFSSSDFTEILKQFSIKPDSQEAQSMKDTLELCASPAIKGETKTCATSLESMIDFTTSKLGKNARVFETEAEKEAPKQQYTVGAGVHKIESEKSVACHSEAYVYAVYNCHETQNTSAYKVPLVGEDGTKVNAVAVCHKDTSKWNPKHIAFQVLKVKPGSVPICHFIPEDHLLWVE